MVMARGLKHGAVEVQVEPTLICTVAQDVSEVLIQNVSSADVFVGGSGVATDGDNQGFMLKPGESEKFPTFEFDSTDVFAVVDDGRPTARVVFLVSA
jgi:hypothetical protein